MYLLKYVEVIEKLESLGYLKSLKTFESEERILQLDFSTLKDIGLHTKENNYLLVVFR
jgi:hypothetical protein